MSKWKKTLIFLLRLLASLRVYNLMGSKDSNKPTANAATSASALASVTSGPKYSAPLSRSQLSSLLRSDSARLPRRIDLIVIHCSDTRADQDYTIERLARDHRARGFGEWPGYHVYIRRDGTCYYCRPLRVKGCHVSGWNANSIGVCYEGGHAGGDVLVGGGGARRTAEPPGTVAATQMPATLPPGTVAATQMPATLAPGTEAASCLHVPFGRSGKYEDNRTQAQIVALQEVVATLRECFPDARVVGHNELNPLKACPCLSQEAMGELSRAECLPQ